MYPLISIIVPVFNTEQYLPRCIDSILSQGFTDFELLLIDDGSTDGSGAICDAYAAKDSRVRVFHKENGGVSSARNLGIDNARGEWLYFVDSDDELLPNGLQTLADGISDDVDVVMAGYEKLDANGSSVETIGADGAMIVLCKQESISSLYHGHALGYFYIGWMWMRMFRNKVIRNEMIRFDTELAVKEDTLFTTQYLCRTNGVTKFVKKPVYRYRMRSESAMGGWRKGFDYAYVDSFKALVKMKQEIEKNVSPDSELLYIAKEGIWRRFVEIKDKALETGFEGADMLVARMKVDLSKEGIGCGFLVRKKLRKLKRKWCR